MKNDSIRRRPDTPTTGERLIALVLPLCSLLLLAALCGHGLWVWAKRLAATMPAFF